MEFSKTEIDYIDDVDSRVKYEVGCFDVSMNESCIMNYLDSVKHLNQNRSCVRPRHSLIRKIPLYLRQIGTK